MNSVELALTGHSVTRGTSTTYVEPFPAKKSTKCRDTSQPATEMVNRLATPKAHAVVDGAPQIRLSVIGSALPDTGPGKCGVAAGR